MDFWNSTHVLCWDDPLGELLLVASSSLVVVDDDGASASVLDENHRISLMQLFLRIEALPELRIGKLN